MRPGLRRPRPTCSPTRVPRPCRSSTTDGYRPLREFIAARYRHRVGLDVTAENIQIVNGSQQCLDLVAKCLVDPGDPVAIEAPGYLGAIEAFSLYEPRLSAIPVGEGGPDLAVLERALGRDHPEVLLRDPERAEPVRTHVLGRGETGCRRPPRRIGYSPLRGRRVRRALLRRPVTAAYREPTCRAGHVLSGSFSKVLAPGMRCGWLVAPEEVLAQFNVAKQAADLHSNHLCQLVLHRWLTTHDLDAQCRRVARLYEENCRALVDALDDLCPGLAHTTPEGGMFMLARLPRGVSSLAPLRGGRTAGRGRDAGTAVLP